MTAHRIRALGCVRGSSTRNVGPVASASAPSGMERSVRGSGVRAVRSRCTFEIHTGESCIRAFVANGVYDPPQWSDVLTSASACAPKRSLPGAAQGVVKGRAGGRPAAPGHWRTGNARTSTLNGGARRSVPRRSSVDPDELWLGRSQTKGQVLASSGREGHE
jgi:hypothetical protein